MLQIKNMPDELKERLAARAKEQGTTMSALVIDIIWRDLSVPSTADWAERMIRKHAGKPIVTDTLWAVDEARKEYDPDERFDGAGR